jgi:hypothetical protein
MQEKPFSNFIKPFENLVLFWENMFVTILECCLEFLENFTFWFEAI